MVSHYFEIKVEIEEIVPNANHTGDKDPRYEIMYSERGHEKRNSAGNGERAADCNQDEIHIAVMYPPARTLEYVLP